MTPLLDRPRTGRSTAGVLPSPWVAGAVAAVQAAAGSLVVVLAPVVAAWAVTTNTGGDAQGGAPAPWLTVVRLALAIWVLAQHAGLGVPGGWVGLVPLGLAAVPLAASWFAGRRLARSLDPNAERIEAGASRARRAGVPWTAMLAMTVTYAGLATAAAWLATTATIRPVLWQAAAGSGVVALVGGWLGGSAYRHAGAVAGVRAVLRLLPRSVRGRVADWATPAVAALGVHLAGAAVVLVVCLLLGAGRITAISGALDTGLVGGVVLALAQVALLPNLVVWAASALAGPGFAVGAGTAVSPAASTLGPLPAVPVLAALPNPGPLPTPVLAVLVVPFAAGAVAGAVLLRRTSRPGRFALLADLVGIAVLAGLALGVLAWLSGGPAGPGRLATVGPQPVLVGAVFAAEVLVGGLVTLLVRQFAPSAADAAAEGVAAGVAATVGRLRGGYRRRP